MNPQLAMTPWILITGLVAPVVGFLATLLGCIRHGLPHGGLLFLMKREWRSFAWLAFVDAFGGWLTGIAVWLASPSRLSILSFAQTSPILFWALVGVLGPVAASGLLGRTSGDLRLPKVGRIPLRDLRRELTGRIFDVLDQVEDVWLRTRDDWVVWSFRSCLRDGRSVVEELIEDVEGFVKVAPKRRKVRLPRRWDDSKSNWRALPLTSRDSQSALVAGEAVARCVIAGGMVDRVASVCRIRLSEFDYNDHRALKETVEGSSLPSKIEDLEPLPQIDFGDA